MNQLFGLQHRRGEKYHRNDRKATHLRGEGDVGATLEYHWNRRTNATEVDEEVYIGQFVRIIAWL